MSEKRLSNLQKWILVNCYRVTVLRERTDKKLAKCEYFDNDKCRDNVKPHPAHPNIYDCKTRGYDGIPSCCSAFEFTQNDIYMNYYRLEQSRRLYLYTNSLHFKHTPESDKIYNSTTRTLKSLKEKGLIIYTKSTDTKIILLTDEGKATAEKLLDDKSIFPPSHNRRRR